MRSNVVGFLLSLLEVVALFVRLQQYRRRELLVITIGGAPDASWQIGGFARIVHPSTSHVGKEEMRRSRGIGETATLTSSV